MILGAILLSGLVWGQEVDHHVVQKGESIYSISRKYSMTPQKLMELNQIRDPKKIRIGQRLQILKESLVSDPKKPDRLVKKVIPVPERYVVQKNETYSQIAQKFDVDEKLIREWNHNVDLEGGVVLILKENKVKSVPKVVLPSEEEELKNKGSRYLFISEVKHLIDLPKIQKNRWKYIVVHHSATTSGNAPIFDLAHRQRGMENGLAYHFVIGNGKDSRDGQIEVGNRWLKQLKGGHVRSESINQIAIGICFVGNFEEGRPSRRQMASAIELIHYLRMKLGAPYPEFKGHREINPIPTSCPGRYFPLKAFHQIFDS